MAAHQAPQSLGFCRQEHWSGLPFPSPMHESESESEVAQSYPTLSDPMDCSLQAPPSMRFSRQEYWSGVPLPSPSKMLTLNNYLRREGAAWEVGSFLFLEVCKPWLVEHCRALDIRCLCTDYLPSLEPLRSSKISHLPQCQAKTPFL